MLEYQPVRKVFAVSICFLSKSFILTKESLKKEIQVVQNKSALKSDIGLVRTLRQKNVLKFFFFFNFILCFFGDSNFSFFCFFSNFTLKLNS